MSSNDSNADAPMVFGVPASTIAASLREAGLTEDAVIAVLGQGISRSAAAAAATGFTFQVQIAETAPECALTYERLFVHPDFIDGVTVVQAGQTPDEIGFNARFHALEGEFDSIARDLSISSNCVAELRRELFQLTRELQIKITEIDARIAAKGKDKDTKEGKESKEGKEGKETKEKDSKEGKDKEGKDHKDGKDKEHIDKITHLEKLVAIEKQLDTPIIADEPSGRARTFITLEDRPDVGATALEDDEPPQVEPSSVKKAIAKKAPAKKPAAEEAPAKKAAAKKAAAKKAAKKAAAPRPESGEG